MPPGDDGRRLLSPTDLTQFIMLGQCRRQLRLRLHQRRHGRAFLRRANVRAQEIPPLRTRAGQSFEAAVFDQIAARFPLVDLRDVPDNRDRNDHNELVIEAARSLPAGSAVVLAQPFLDAAVGGWRLRGQADLIRLDKDDGGNVRALLVDVKRSAASRVEHRLQVACYDRMLAAVLADGGLTLARSDLGVLFHGPPVPDHDPEPEARAALARQAAAARERLGVSGGYLDVVADPDAFQAELDRLVFDPDSLAAEVASAPFAQVPFHLCARCDQCLYAEYCLRWAAERDDLSLVPHLTERDKSALLTAGVTSVAALAGLKVPAVDPISGEEQPWRLMPAPGKQAAVAALGATPPVGPRLDELVQRARRLRRDTTESGRTLASIPGAGLSSLPASTPELHPNLVRVFIDAQQDYLTGRVYLIGALVVAHERGETPLARQRAVVRMADRPPDAAAETELLVGWVRDTIAAIVELAAPDEAGGRTAPIHVVLWSGAERTALLEALDRGAGAVLGATALHEFLTQVAGFDSPVVTLLADETARQKNYPFLCQSLHAVARYLRFDWGPHRQTFKTRVFDDKLPLERADGAGSKATWYTARARFGSAIPLEYAYAAWNDLPPPPPRQRDDPYRAYRGVTTDQLLAFQERRLRALAWIAADLKPNAESTKTSFDLPDLASYSDRARTLAHALEEFLLIERQVELAEWRSARYAPPERRVLAGVSLLARYRPGDQDPEVRQLNATRRGWSDRRQAALSTLRETNPEAGWNDLAPEPRTPDLKDRVVRLRLESASVGASLDDVLGLTGFREGDWLLTRPRWTTDTRPGATDRVPRAPTPKQLLYGLRGRLARIEVERDTAGRAMAAWAHFEVGSGHFNEKMRPFAFATRGEDFYRDDELVTIEADPNDLYRYSAWKTVRETIDGTPNALFVRLGAPEGTAVGWPPPATEGQARFLAGLEALHAAAELHPFPPEVREYVGAYGGEPLLLVQGPPGTGKSYTTAFALFARLQGAMAADRPLRIGAGANTHAATDVLLEKLCEVRDALGRWQQRHPALFARYFDPRLLSVPLWRFAPKGPLPPGAVELDAQGDRKDKPPDRIAAARWCVVAATPSGLKNLCGSRASARAATLDCLVLDEASRMTVPEGMLAAVPLRPDGPIIVVGDHRQMQPIRKHDWDNEPRLTFREYKVYRSLFDTVRALAPPAIKLSESHRLHEEMAEFLRREIYVKDQIPFRSTKRWLIAAGRAPDPYVAAVLDRAYPIVVVVHDEAASQVRNETERALIEPLAAEILARGYRLTDGFGIVVPHRAQRALLQESLRHLSAGEPTVVAAAVEAVDTVERFQGGEREVIVVSATESDPAYLLAAGEFLYDPSRLTVALSRAKQKLVLVASRSVFGLISRDEEVFENALLWKNLLRRTCTDRLWSGAYAGREVWVWGRRARVVGEVAAKDEPVPAAVASVSGPG